MSGIWLISYAALWILFLAVAVVQLVVLRNLGVLYDHLGQQELRLPPPSRLVAGEPLPEIALATLDGRAVSTADWRGRKLAISLVSGECGSCRQFLIELAANHAAPDPLDPTVTERVIVGIGPEARARTLLADVALAPTALFLDRTGAVGSGWGISSTPMTVVIDDESKVVRHILGKLPG